MLFSVKSLLLDSKKALRNGIEMYARRAQSVPLIALRALEDALTGKYEIKKEF